MEGWFRICGVNVARYVNGKKKCPKFCFLPSCHAQFAYFMKQIAIFNLYVSDGFLFVCT